MYKAHNIDRITALKRKEERRVEELHKYSQQSRWLSNCAEKEIRIDDIREAKVKAKQEAEDEQRRLLLEKNENRQRDLVSKERERRLAQELHKQKVEQEAREIEIQRVCDSSSELKELERRLKIAYVNKERKAQHQEALLLRKLENDREHAIDEKMEADRLLDIQRKEERELHRKQHLVAQKSVLQDQITAREKERGKLKDEALKDKQMIDAIISKINKEDELEREARREKVQETRELVAKFQAERLANEQHKQNEQHQQDAEIRRYNDMMAQRQAEENAEKNRAEEEKKRRWKKVVEETQNQTQSKEEYDNLRNMLWEEEHEARQKKQEEDAIVRAREQKQVMIQQNAQNIEAKKALLVEQATEEQEMVKSMLRKFAQDEEDELRVQENRRLFKQRFMAEANQQREEKEMLLQQGKELEAREELKAKEREEYRQRVLEAAKERLLAKHSDELQGFMPK